MALTLPIRFLLTSIILVVMAFPSASQHVITNSAGERVVIYPDGTWRHAEIGDSLLIKKNPYRKTNSKNHIDGQPMNESEQYNFLLRQWNDLYAAINHEKIEAQKKFRDATNAKFKASEDYLSAEANKQVMEPVRLAELEDALDQSVRNLQQSKKQQNSIKTILEKADKVNALLSKLTENKVDKIRGQFFNYLKNFEPQLLPEPASVPKKQKSSKTVAMAMWCFIQ